MERLGSSKMIESETRCLESLFVNEKENIQFGKCQTVMTAKRNGIFEAKKST